MFTERLARDLAELARVGEASTEHVLQRINALVVRDIPGCSGGTVQVWESELITQVATSHSELTMLLDRERALGQGVSFAALSSMNQVLAEDLLHEERWPGYARAAIRYGVRSVMMLPFHVGSAGDDTVVTLGLYAARPQAFGAAAGANAWAILLAEQVRVALRNARDYDVALAEALQMQEALANRAEIDQAKGILMHARGLDAESAFQELRRVSQHHQIKVSDVARKLVREQRKDPP
ncbi:ANTAR domain-containing response regulator [Rhizohabitans arisaemae]|uniref:ANTAR domain-containing response regulator n=1 Tax=Rhizohabitans arisaemae TaxID=2720610 RepID=UPI0024B1ED84|nr:ANTAR domain-containing protein [Rhizohabitans arisaemae]